MTAKGLLTRLAFSLVLAAGMMPWAVGQGRHVDLQPALYQIWTPYLPGPNMYHYLGPIAPYAPGFFPVDDTNSNSDESYGPLFLPPRYNPSLPGSTPAPWQYAAPDWYYRQPYYGPPVYPPPFYGGYYYYPRSAYPRYYGYSYDSPWYRWHGDLQTRMARPNAQAPTEVPRSR